MKTWSRGDVVLLRAVVDDPIPDGDNEIVVNIECITKGERAGEFYASPDLLERMDAEVRQAVKVQQHSLADQLEQEALLHEGLHGPSLLTKLARMAAHALQPAEAKPDDDGWIEWDGGEQPVAPDARVEVRFRSDRPDEVAMAGQWRWNHWHKSRGGEPNPHDIVAYRLVKE